MHLMWGTRGLLQQLDDPQQLMRNQMITKQMFSSQVALELDYSAKVPVRSAVVARCASRRPVGLTLSR